MESLHIYTNGGFGAQVTKRFPLLKVSHASVVLSYDDKKHKVYSINMLKWIRQGVNRFPLLSNVRGQNTFMPKLGHRGSTGHRWQVRSPRDGKSTSEI